MKKKDVHVVFGYQAGATLAQSGILDLKDSEIVVLLDMLNIGPLCDLYSQEGIEKREDYFLHIFDHSPYNDNGVKSDIEKIKAIAEHDKIYLWLGNAEYEIISTSRILHHLSKLEADIFLVDYSNIPVQLGHEVIIYPKSLSILAAEQVKTVAQYFKLLDSEALQKWSVTWEKLLSENSLLRVVDEHGEILHKDLSYFDPILTAHCKNIFQKAARVIGQTLGTMYEMNSFIGDSYLNYRLKQLVLDKKLDSKGELKEIRDYEVRLIAR